MVSVVCREREVRLCMTFVTPAGKYVGYVGGSMYIGIAVGG
jgi:hypothetical protein